MMRKGFSMVEMIVVFMILGILATSGITVTQRSSRRQSVQSAAEQIRGALRQAQAQALAGRKVNCVDQLESWNVNFTATGYSIDEECLGVKSGGVKTLPVGAKITTLPSPNPIKFKVLGQGTNVTGSTTLKITNQEETASIIISSTGEIQ
ncbi:MAG: type II secretion system protein [Patescibacteria group bacterium]|mgnify:CR=1 FL=1